uniref:Anillin homology domain-containing protein n=1 Tax=Panagrolaimus sp. PS1159 TaxID=55785 RepID=A0AC35G323_9BILA
RLQSKLATEQNRLRDAKSTIQYWRKREGNQQSWNEICAHALLLLSEIRIDTYRELITRVNAFHHLKHGPPPTAISARSVYTIYRMDINLSRDYYLKNTADDPNYVFILVGSTSEKTVASQLVEVSDTSLMRSRRFHIDEEMVFKNLPINFRIFLKLYVMKIEQRSRTPKALAKKMAASLFSKFTPPVPNHNTSIGSRNDEDVTTGFELAGSFIFSRSSIGHFTAFFDNPIYPLDGSAEVNSKVSALPEELATEVKGIWKFFSETEVISYYIEKKDGILNCFEIPDEQNQLEGPKFTIDLSTICNTQIEPGNPLSAEHQFIFSFEVVVFPRGSDESSQKNYVVGVETEEELFKWINTINAGLQIIRGKQ